MTSHESAFEAAQRARWLRPDAYRWIRPDAARFLAPGTDPREVYAATEHWQPYIRETYGVRVVIVPDRRSEKGYRVETAFPRNE